MDNMSKTPTSRPSQLSLLRVRPLSENSTFRRRHKHEISPFFKKGMADIPVAGCFSHTPKV